jgi:hypothetical protein
MKQAARLLILLFVSSMHRPTFFFTVIGADCIVDCMQRSGCWSGGSVSDPGRCNNLPGLCRIQCSGKTDNTWGAIAYSKKDQMAGPIRKAIRPPRNGLLCKPATRKAASNACWRPASMTRVARSRQRAIWSVGALPGRNRRHGSARCRNVPSKAPKSVSWKRRSAPPPTPAPRRQSSVRPAPRGIAWGAIAYSNRDMGAGWAQGKSDRASAEKEAMSACAQRGKGCVLETAFKKTRGALAADRDFTGWGTSADAREAQQKAIDSCKKAGGSRCALHIFFCSM